MTDDLLAIGDHTFQQLDGDRGEDTVRLDASGFWLDLTAIPDNRILSVEKFDITGSGDNTLVLSIAEVLNISHESNSVTVIGDVGDEVNIGTGWTDMGISQSMHVFVAGSATLRISETVTANVPQPFVDLSSLLPASRGDGTAGFVLNGESVDSWSGYSVGAAGDVNGDGFEDVVIGAPSFMGSGKLGRSYVVYGQTDGFTAELNLSSLDGTRGFIIASDSNDLAGTSVSKAGDINGDGVDDLIVGAPEGTFRGNIAGKRFVVFGQIGGFGASPLMLSSLDGTNGFAIGGRGINAKSGASVSAAGDVNRDGFNDLVIGASGADRDGNLNIGEAYVVFGTAGGFPASLDVSTLDGSDGFTLRGIDARDKAGDSVSSGGDFNLTGTGSMICSSVRLEAPSHMAIPPPAKPTSCTGDRRDLISHSSCRSWTAPMDW